MSKQRVLARPVVIALAGLMLWMVLLATPEFGCVVHSAPNGTQVIVKPPRRWGASPTMSWLESDSTKLFVGIEKGYVRSGRPNGWVIDPGTRHPPVPASEADTLSDSDYLRSRWAPSAHAPHYEFIGVNIPAPRLVGWSLVPIPSGIEWEPHVWGLESIVLGTSSGSKVLLRRWVWNSRAPEMGRGGREDKRGQFVGFLKRTRGGWGVWIWPSPSKREAAVRAN